MNNEAKYKYKIADKNPIGSGNFSSVYKVQDKKDNIYALKCVPIERIDKKHLNDQFLREIDISLKLNHPNIVKTYETFKTEKNYYIVNEYCGDGTLANVMAKNSSMSYYEKEALCKKYLSQLKSALKYLYKNNIIHRDLKPSNILISGNNIKLADFGFSRYFDPTETFTMSSFCGTPIYMAPELLKEKQYTNKVELWSFGIIMYEMLYGVKPYTSLGDIIHNKELDIDCDTLYSSSCINLMKSLLVKNVENRISWEDFIKHPWFMGTITSYNSIDNISPNLELSVYDTQKLTFNTDTINIDDEYEIIDNTSISAEINDYKEVETTSIIQFLTTSVYGILSKTFSLQK